MNTASGPIFVILWVDVRVAWRLWERKAGSVRLVQILVEVVAFTFVQIHLIRV